MQMTMQSILMYRALYYHECICLHRVQAVHPLFQIMSQMPPRTCDDLIHQIIQTGLLGLLEFSMSARFFKIGCQASLLKHFNMFIFSCPSPGMKITFLKVKSDSDEQLCMCVLSSDSAICILHLRQVRYDV
jgi:hypothetical protein